MSNNKDNRVLNRRGARQLTSEELEQIKGAGGPFTRASLTGTGTMLSTDSDMELVAPAAETPTLSIGCAWRDWEKAN